MLGEWTGLAWIVGTIFVCFATIGFGIILAEVFGRENAVLWIVGLQCAFQMLISFSSALFVGLDVGGIAFLTIAGSLIYPTIELGQNYLNEFYGAKVSRTSVNAQMVSRVLTSLLLLFLFLLPVAPGYEQNHANFVELNGIVPRISGASIAATWVGGLVMVYVYALVMKRTRGKHLWLRALSANVVAMAVNSVLFVVFAFAGVLSVGILINMIMIQVLFKFIDSFLELGFLYGMQHLKATGRLDRGALVEMPEVDPRDTPTAV